MINVWISRFCFSWEPFCRLPPLRPIMGFFPSRLFLDFGHKVASKIACVSGIWRLTFCFPRRVEIDSGEFPRQLRPFLAERTEHFVHEFHSFARSPFDMTAYDERAQYSWPGSNGRAEPEPETPTVFHGSSTGSYRDQWGVDWERVGGGERKLIFLIV